jgi:murein L,D-transpeptidase YcbB/YkuD
MKMITCTDRYTCVDGSRLAGSVLAATLTFAAAAFALSCGRSDDGGPSTAGIGALNPFAHRVELQLQPYLQQLSGPPLGLGDAAAGSLVEPVRTFYQRRGAQPAWFVEGRPRPEAGRLIDFLTGLDGEGLDPLDYRPRELAQALAAVRNGEAGVRPEDVEVGLTWAALLAASDLRHGRATPEVVEKRWLVKRDRVDLPQVLQQGLDRGEVVAALEALSPQHPQFRALLAALQRYREIARNGGWPRVPEGPVLREGERGDAARLHALARRLQIEGFLGEVPASLAAAPQPAAPQPAAGAAPAKAAAQPATAPYGPELADAVRRFQSTRTVEIDGSLGPETQKELNVPVATRLRQLALNVERWRWVPDDFGTRAVVVNLPGFHLYALENGTPVMTMRTVVGEEGWETPVFSDRIRYLVLNPYWNVPPNIFAKEILPAMQRDPSYLWTHDMEWMENRDSVRQRPGPENPLGKVKFMFPNDHDIYLHDTPADALFDEPDRQLSHGCIRVEHPFDLADWLVRDNPKWNGGQLRAAIDRGEQRDVPLEEPVPVYLLYFTASPRADGAIAFYEDIYGLDRAHGRALATIAARRPGGEEPAAEEVARGAGGEAPHGAAAWSQARRPGEFRQAQRQKRP